MSSANKQEAVLAALDELRERKYSFDQAMAEIDGISEKATNKKKTVEATVDASGRLLELRLRGDSWREMAPSELCGKIVEVVKRAQDKSFAAMSAKAAAFLPPGMDVAGLRKSGPDIDAIIKDTMENLMGWSG